MRLNIPLRVAAAGHRTPSQGPVGEYGAELACGPSVCRDNNVVMLVRPGALDDLLAMAAVFRRAVLTNAGDRDLLSEHPEFTVLEPPAEDDVVLVAEVTGHLVGFATARGIGDDAFTVTDLFVDPDHMRSGVGRALMDVVVAAARRSGRTRVEVEANPHAVAFYGRLGFAAVQEVRVEFGTALRMVMSVPVPLLRGRP